jgi:hypothetical protein
VGGALEREPRLRWGAEEIEDVTLYLNGTYYRFACPPPACKVVS